MVLVLWDSGPRTASAFYSAAVAMTIEAAPLVVNADVDNTSTGKPRSTSTPGRISLCGCRHGLLRSKDLRRERDSTGIRHDSR